MNEYIERFMERPRSHKIVFWLISLLVIFGIGYQWFLAPIWKKKTEITKEIESLQGQISNETRTIRNLPKFQAEVKALEALKDLALSQLPYKREISNFLQSVELLARESGLEVNRFAPEPDQIKDFYAEVPVSVIMRGGFHQVLTFLDELSRLPRILSVYSLTFSNPRGFQDNSYVDLDITSTLTTYRHLEESEKINIDDQQKEKNKEKNKGEKS